MQFGPMGRTLFGQVLADPGFVPQIFKHVGIPPMLDWVRHFSALGTYTLLDKVGSSSHALKRCLQCSALLPVHATRHSAAHACPMAGLEAALSIVQEFCRRELGHLMCKPHALFPMLQKCRPERSAISIVKGRRTIMEGIGLQSIAGLSLC